ncbi:DUF2252 domain-containing protein [Flavihumibacter sp. R14]|nr:DUF2252 domain-containing protein [Flavihumibacter soli]
MRTDLLPGFRSKPLSVEERIAAGKALRTKIPHHLQGIYKPAANRADPVSILEKQGKTRLKHLVPVRYARMLTSPFAFLRGAAAIMAADLSANGETTGIQVQACGDMHVANFGIFASVERNLIFGINDFDETLPGPWEWDLKRLVASIVPSCRFLGVDKRSTINAVRVALNSYRKRMKEYANMGSMELWYATISEKDILKTLPPAQQKALKKMTGKARTRTHMQVLGKLTDIVDQEYRLRDDPPFIVHETHTQAGVPIEEALAILLESYFLSIGDDRKNLLQHYRIVDVARKVVGVGSVGTRSWIIFLIGNNAGDPLFLQVKEAERSVMEPFLSRSVYKNHGQRVVQGQRLLQAAPDIFLGWGEQSGKHFYIRQLRDMKGGAEFDPSKLDFANISHYCSLCAWALALAHAKSGDAAMISGYIGRGDEFEEALVQFAFAYAEQTENDYQALVEAGKSGRVKIAAVSE